ncbi:MAG: hypothetical protein IH984_15755 [Planctomycetes bacterium]|nr:hypothetical protein [Planctomycetota bacterium]
MTDQQRIEILETQVRRLRWVFIGVVLFASIAIALIVTRPKVMPDVIKAGAFEVVDASGRVVAKMGHHLNNGGIWIFNDQGNSAAFLTIDEFGAGSLSLYNGKDPRKPTDHKVLFALSSDNAQQAIMRILSDQGHGLKLLGDSDSTVGRIETINDQGETIDTWP